MSLDPPDYQQQHQIIPEELYFRSQTYSQHSQQKKGSLWCAPATQFPFALTTHHRTPQNNMTLAFSTLVPPPPPPPPPPIVKILQQNMINYDARCSSLNSYSQDPSQIQNYSPENSVSRKRSFYDEKLNHEVLSLRNLNNDFKSEQKFMDHIPRWEPPVKQRNDPSNKSIGEAQIVHQRFIKSASEKELTSDYQSRAGEYTLAINALSAFESRWISPASNKAKVAAANKVKRKETSSDKFNNPTTNYTTPTFQDEGGSGEGVAISYCKHQSSQEIATVEKHINEHSKNDSQKDRISPGSYTVFVPPLSIEYHGAVIHDLSNTGGSTIETLSSFSTTRSDTLNVKADQGENPLNNIQHSENSDGEDTATNKRVIDLTSISGVSEFFLSITRDCKDISHEDSGLMRNMAVAFDESNYFRLEKDERATNESKTSPSVKEKKIEQVYIQEKAKVSSDQLLPDQEKTNGGEQEPKRRRMKTPKPAEKSDFEKRWCNILPTEIIDLTAIDDCADQSHDESCRIRNTTSFTDVDDKMSSSAVVLYPSMQLSALEKKMNEVDKQVEVRMSLTLLEPISSERCKGGSKTIPKERSENDEMDISDDETERFSKKHQINIENSEMASDVDNLTLNQKGIRGFSLEELSPKTELKKAKLKLVEQNTSRIVRGLSDTDSDILHVARNTQLEVQGTYAIQSSEDASQEKTNPQKLDVDSGLTQHATIQDITAMRMVNSLVIDIGTLIGSNEKVRFVSSVYNHFCSDDEVNYSEINQKEKSQGTKCSPLHSVSNRATSKSLKQQLQLAKLRLEIKKKELLFKKKQSLSAAVSHKSNQTIQLGGVKVSSDMVKPDFPAEGENNSSMYQAQESQHKQCTTEHRLLSGEVITEMTSDDSHNKDIVDQNSDFPASIDKNQLCINRMTAESKQTQIEELRHRQKVLKKETEILHLKNLIHRQRDLLRLKGQELTVSSSLLQACIDEIKSKQKLLSVSEQKLKDMNHRKRVMEGIVLRATEKLMIARKNLRNRQLLNSTVSTSKGTF